MWKRILGILPGVAVSLAPKVTCPLCWPAYAGLLSSLGLGFLLSSRYLLPLTAAFLLIAIAALGFGAHARRGYGPMTLGVMAAAGVIAGKFYVASDVMLYGAVSLLIAASLWNSWPRPAKAQVQGLPASSELIQLSCTRRTDHDRNETKSGSVQRRMPGMRGDNCAGEEHSV